MEGVRLSLRFVRWILLVVSLFGAAGASAAATADGERDITLQGSYFIDTTGRMTVAEAVQAAATQAKRMDRHQSFELGESVLWMRFDLPAAATETERRYLMLSGGAFINRATLYLRSPDGTWQEQRAGDHVPVAQWHLPNFSPLFTVPAKGGETWLRIENRPAPTNAFVQLLTGDGLEQKRQWTYLLIGGYFGFCLLVFIVGIVHARLYGDIAFDVYCLYVACMLLFQFAYTGLGGLFLWPEQAWLNDAAPAMFMLLMVGSGIWFIREATALSRHSRWLDRFVIGFCAFGLVFQVVYVLFLGPFVYRILNVYALMSVVLSISLCLWTWRRGERYSGWLFLGFMPIHLTYPFPALRAAGLMPDSWLTQYAVLIGSALEIPLLLWILHWRAKDFSENRVRLRALDSTDPLTGLTGTPVLRLRLRDALRRARRSGHRCVVMLVELANHGEIAAREGREAGDRALVVAGSRLSSVVRDVDTVSRIADTRFAILSEGPQPEDARRVLAQHVVARGLDRVDQLPTDLNLRFRVVTAWVPDGAIEESSVGGTVDETRMMQRMNWALDRLVEDPKRVVLHLEARSPETDEPAPTAPAQP
jgi:two-component system, sensor histidine kinase LadS